MVEPKFQVKGGFLPYLSVSGDIKIPSEITLELCLQKAMLKSSFLGFSDPLACIKCLILVCFRRADAPADTAGVSALKLWLKTAGINLQAG